MTLEPISATPFCPQIAKMQADLGQLNAEVTAALSDGQLTIMERNHLVIRLRGLAHEAQNLAGRLRVPGEGDGKRSQM